MAKCAPLQARSGAGMLIFVSKPHISVAMFSLCSYKVACSILLSKRVLMALFMPGSALDLMSLMRSFSPLLNTTALHIRWGAVTAWRRQKRQTRSESHMASKQDHIAVHGAITNTWLFVLKGPELVHVHLIKVAG